MSESQYPIEVLDEFFHPEEEVDSQDALQAKERLLHPGMREPDQL